jgi:hypothetical protein
MNARLSQLAAIPPGSPLRPLLTTGRKPKGTFIIENREFPLVFAGGGIAEVEELGRSVTFFGEHCLRTASKGAANPVWEYDESEDEKDFWRSRFK